MDKKPEPVAWISDDGRPFKSEQEARLNSWNSVSPLYSQQAVDALVAERDALRSERDTAVCFANTAQLLQREAGARALRAEAEAVALREDGARLEWIVYMMRMADFYQLTGNPNIGDWRKAIDAARSGDGRG